MKISTLLFKTAQSVLGLLILAAGIYLTIRANIGLAPWDCFCMGVAGKAGVSYGQVSFSVGVITIVADLLLKEKIGAGTLLNAAICGPTVDLLTYLDAVPLQHTFAGGLAVMLLGIVVQGFGRYIYMSAALCCGPRDALVVGIGKHFRRISIGKVNTAILAIVLAAGMLLGGQFGVGTIISAFGLGTVMQFIFSRFRFDPRSVNNLSLRDYVNVFAGKYDNGR